MANRNYSRVQALEKESKYLYLDVNIAAAGAPTATRKYGSASIVRNSAGNYTITMQDRYMKLLGLQVTQLIASPQDLTFELVSEDVNGANTKTVRFRCLTGAVETDPASGSRLLIKLDLKNSSV